MVKVRRGKKKIKEETGCAICDEDVRKPDRVISPTGCKFFAKTDKPRDLRVIECSFCDKCFHCSCLNIEEYERIWIRPFTYICPDHPEIAGYGLKEQKFEHRFALDPKDKEAHRHTQIGSRKFIQDLRAREAALTQEAKTSALPDDLFMLCDSGKDLMNNFDLSNSWTKHKEGLGLEVPSDITSIERLANAVGVNKFIDVFDVSIQKPFEMSLGRLAELYSQPQPRSRTYNFLSLATEETLLHDEVHPPELVRQLSWVANHWNDSLKDEKPRVSCFCLGAMADSYTDFHIDFGGSSVWYHVVKGKKIFYLAEGNEKNLKAFKEHHLLKERFEVSMEGLLDKVYRIEINEGETLLMPGGWIHAVYTPVDTLVFGGNFLHSLCIEIQLKVNELEIAIDTAETNRYPSFERCNLLGARELLQKLCEANCNKRRVSAYLLRAVKKLLKPLTQWHESALEGRGRQQKRQDLITIKRLQKEFLKQKLLKASSNLLNTAVPSS